MNTIQKQNGSALIIGLILIAVMTLIGVSALNISTQGEILTANQRNVDIALQATESAIREAERWVNSQITRPAEVSVCTTNPCNVWQANVLPSLASQSTSYWQTGARTYSGTIASASAQPRYFIEYYNFIPYELDPSVASYGSGYHLYKITAKGFGGTSTSSSMIESIYSTNYN